MTFLYTALTFLADTSAVWRLLRKQVDEPWPRYVAQGKIAICPPVESELMASVRSGRDYESFFAVLGFAVLGFAVLGRTFGWCPTLDDPWWRILAVQRDLIRIGHHRGLSPSDILIALTAQEHRLTLLHADTDFRSIAKVRPGIGMARVDQP